MVDGFEFRSQDDRLVAPRRLPSRPASRPAPHMARPPSSEVGDEKLRPDTPDFSMPTDGPKATQAVRPADPPALATGSAPPSLSSCAVGSGAGTALDPGCIGDAGSLGVPMEVEPLWGAACTSAFEGDEITEAFVPRVYAALEVEPESRGRFDSTMAAFRDRRCAAHRRCYRGISAACRTISHFPRLVESHEDQPPP